MKFKKVMALALASAMVFSMTACGGSSDDGKKKKEQRQIRNLIRVLIPKM